MRYWALVAVPTVLTAAFFYAASDNRHEVSAQDFVNLQQGNAIQPGFRRAHAKGFCVSGDFISSGTLAEYSSAQVFQAGQYPFIGRFSVAGNNPTAPDLKAPVRSLALTLLPETAEQWRTAMNTPPVLAVGTPEKFYQQLLALQNNTIAEFFAAHPETAAFRNWRASYQPTLSYATEQYHSINAFYLINAAGKQQAVRWAAVPTVGAANQLPDPEAVDALQQELFARLSDGPVIFDLVFSLATSADDENDATIIWPDTNPQLIAGQLQIKQATEQSNGQCNAINFDPLVLPRGILPSADPILRARGAAYAESHRRRAREVLLNTATGAHHE
ncbi:catalase-related peroxidase [Alishewanella longhuensis]|uniref:Catalase-related peroxidase n=1 Tax=Alishewanella longhuensis TaxID=1091037 RepID=A0ABQ3KWK7_9ALTE|nr:catalase family peroxidase [Alishewanella longhuensis]GHG60425.1 catalase-related peroxidase [Alishewanella longhuensis]